MRLIPHLLAMAALPFAATTTNATPGVQSPQHLGKEALWPTPQQIRAAGRCWPTPRRARGPKTAHARRSRKAGQR